MLEGQPRKTLWTPKIFKTLLSVFFLSQHAQYYHILYFIDLFVDYEEIWSILFGVKFPTWTFGNCYHYLSCKTKIYFIFYCPYIYKKLVLCLLIIHIKMQIDVFIYHVYYFSPHIVRWKFYSNCLQHIC